MILVFWYVMQCHWVSHSNCFDVKVLPSSSRVHKKCYNRLSSWNTERRSNQCGSTKIIISQQRNVGWTSLYRSSKKSSATNALIQHHNSEDSDPWLYHCEHVTPHTRQPRCTPYQNAHCLHPVYPPRLRMSGPTLLFPLYDFMAPTRKLYLSVPLLYYASHYSHCCYRGYCISGAVR
jgi:hypothetical protein